MRGGAAVQNVSENGRVGYGVIDLFLFLDKFIKTVYYT